MRSLLNFLLRFKTLILFLILEAVALVMISSSHNYHQTVFYSASRNISGFVAKKIDQATSYFRLHQENKELVEENTLLRHRIDILTNVLQERTDITYDTLNDVKYTYQSARVINNSVNKQKNFFTLNKGSKDGVSLGMGVASPTGVAGVVVGVSRRYSVAMSLLNIDFRLSASIKRNDYFGSLSWDGINYRYARLSDIPHHVVVNVGDTIVTSGYSAIFPAGLMIGTLTGETKRGGDFLSLQVLLSTDFKKMTTVYLIGNLKGKEQEDIEKEVIK